MNNTYIYVTAYDYKRHPAVINIIIGLYAFICMIGVFVLFMGNRAYAMETVNRLFVGDQYDCRAAVSKDSVSMLGVMSAGDITDSTVTKGITDKVMAAKGITSDSLISGSISERVVWSSSNPAVAHVDSKGVVTATRPGLTVITATIKGFKQKLSYVLGVYSYSKRACDYVAHRGFSSKAPGNSLAAIRLAMEAGFDYVEFDIWPTRDNEFVISHDNSLRKSCGMNKYVSDLTMKQVTEYNIIKGKGLKKYRNESVPSLDQVLELAEAFPEAKLSIEIKPELSKEMIVKLLETVDDHGMMGRVRFISFKKANLYAIRRCERLGGDEVLLGYLSHKPNSSSVNTCIELNAELGMNYKLLSNNLVDSLHENGLRVNVWTVPDKSTAEFLINTMKVDSITTDYKLFN